MLTGGHEQAVLGRNFKVDISDSPSTRFACSGPFAAPIHTLVRLITPAAGHEQAVLGRRVEWLPDMDSNHDKEIQNLRCCHYTIGQTEGWEIEAESDRVKASEAHS